MSWKLPVRLIATMIIPKRKLFILSVCSILGVGIFTVIYLTSTKDPHLSQDSYQNRAFNSEQNSNQSSGQSSNLNLNHNAEQNLAESDEIIRNIKQHNEQQPILNEDRFGPLATNSVVIVVQVHTRIDYLEHLIASLSQAKDISSTLLIFSHDYYDENINDLIRQIDFCKVLQIFYPYSIQTHEHEFPGESLNDCPQNMSRDEAIKRKCNNAHCPDQYGHYRTAKITQIKHHWWWKANRVFDQLNVTQHHTGLVLFLEDDHYLAEDFLHMLNSMQNKSNAECAKCNIFTLANHMKSLKEYSRSKTNEVGIVPWGHSINLGFAFNRSTWHEIVECANTFCTYDDYNWDFSLHHVSQKCLSKKLYTMISKRARAFHIGICGSHIHSNDCDPNKLISEIQHLLQTAKESNEFYPESLEILTNSTKDVLLGKSNGGWGDIRDHHLCLNFTQSET